MQQQRGQVVKLYSLERVEAAEASSPTPPARPLPHNTKKAAESTKRRPDNAKKAKGGTKPRSRRTGMTSDREDALAGSMLAQLKDGTSEMLDALIARLVPGEATPNKSSPAERALRSLARRDPDTSPIAAVLRHRLACYRRAETLLSAEPMGLGAA